MKILVLKCPVFVDGVDTEILNPRDTWDDKDGYDLQAQKLVKMFSDNFDAFKPYVDIDILEAAPNLTSCRIKISELHPNFYQN